MSNKLLGYLDIYRYNNIYGLDMLLKKFDPLFTKYAKKSDCSEDLKSDLIIYFITIIKKIINKKIYFKEDKYFLSYINIAIKRKYTVLIKKYKNEAITLYDNECLEIYTNNSNIEFYDIIKKLNEKEKIILEKKFIYNYTNTEIANSMNVSRQNIQICLKRSLLKLKQQYMINII